ncbi:Hypothetical protein LLA12_02499 [Lactococcus lactis subsp. lactis]|nr:Hypothetical protein LLA12_02499 [Lactococcus lactis subsp. lactis]
MFENELKFE